MNKIENETEEKVYLGDWLYNAGIIGFLRIVGYEDNPYLEIGTNYIKFDRKILEGFSEKYFNTAFEQYGRFKKIKENYQENIDKLDEIILKDKIEENEKKLLENILKPYEKVKDASIIKSFFKDKNIVIPKLQDIIKNISILKTFIIEVDNLIKDNYNSFLGADVYAYLSTKNIFGQKSFLQKTVQNENKQKKLFEEFEEPLLNNSNKISKSLYCICCSDRKAKDGTIFDTGLSPYLGLNKDALNFAWNFNTKLPICEICELIYFCYFASLTDVSKGLEKEFYFVNNDSSLNDLMKSNNLLKEVLNKNIKENLIVDFFSELIIKEEEQKSIFSLQNIAFIELNLSNDILPKIHSFNISSNKAKFFKDNSNKLRFLSKLSYKMVDEYKNIAIEFVKNILVNNVNYKFLDKLFRVYISSKDPKKTKIAAYFNINSLNELNLLIFEYLKMIVYQEGKMDLSNKEIWYIWGRGQELSKEIKSRNQENKINSLAYKMLNALRVGNINLFMDINIRLHMSYNLEIPSTFLKAISDEKLFYPIGYSFINGLLGKEEKNKEEK